MNLSFLSRLLWAFILILTLAMIGPYVYFKNVLSHEVLSEAVNEAGVLLDYVSREYRQSDIDSPSGLQEWLKHTGQGLEVRLTYIAEGGEVLADSSLPFEAVQEMENHADRPEIVQARQEGWGSSIRFSDTLRIDFIYTAIPQAAKNGIPRGYLRLAEPVSSISLMLKSLEKRYVSVVLLLLAAAAVVSLFLARQISRNISSMVETAEAIGKGEYTRRIRSYPAKEILPLAKSINEMAESIESHIQTITDQKEQFEAILNGMQEGVMVLDAGGTVKSINRAMHRIFNIPVQVEGRQPIEVVRSPELQERCERIIASQPQDMPESEKILVETQDDRFYDVTIIPLGKRHSKLGAIIVFHEITELKRLERVRKDFVANVSHELRTPLTSIKGYAETLHDASGADASMVQSFMEVVIKNANTMSNLLDDLLQLAKLESSEVSISLQSVSLGNALHAAWKFCSTLAGAKGVELVDETGRANPMVWADYDQLVQVLRNLLENAVKYSPEKSSVHVGAESFSETEWLIRVTDSGPGVPKKDQERIFERFYRLDKHRNGIVPGTGLGLAICRHILRNLGGRIWVESPVREDGKGSTFAFTLKKDLAPGS